MRCNYFNFIIYLSITPVFTLKEQKNMNDEGVGEINLFICGCIICVSSLIEGEE